MKAHLMYPEKDFDMQPALPPNESALSQDLELATLVQGMSGNDEFLAQVIKCALFSGLGDDAETVLYRQSVLKDCLKNQTVIRTLYDISLEAIEGKRQRWLGVFSHYPSGILSESVRLLQMLMEVLGKLKRVVMEANGKFESAGFNTLFATLEAELADDYFATVKAQLKELEFRDGVLMSAELGQGNQGVNHVLHPSDLRKRNWFERLFRRSEGYTFHLDPRDEAGFRSLSELQDQGINLAANAVAQASDHISNFFIMMRTELAFYIGCINLHEWLRHKHVPVCFPVPMPHDVRTQSFEDLRDTCLVLSTDQTVVGNDLVADGKNLFIITGANQGGKSTFLRSIGIAQLMMQCGMFVTAQAYGASLCRGLFTHYKREEDASMKSGKFDEEMDRMSTIVDRLKSDSLLLFNESFAATNEREGAEIAIQIVRALQEAGVKIFFVTHNYELANELWEKRTNSSCFLRAERQDDGRRTFKLLPGPPLATSYGTDLYQEIFEPGNSRKALIK